MKLHIIGILLMAIANQVVAQEEQIKQNQRIERENTEWCDIWIPSASKTDKPHVLLVGDSITKGYYKSVCKNTAGHALPNPCDSAIRKIFAVKAEVKP